MIKPKINIGQYKRSGRLLLLTVALAMFAVSCSIFRKVGSFKHPGAVHQVEGQNIVINGSLEADSATIAFLEPYRKGVEKRLNDFVAQVEESMSVEPWGGSLGNLVADMLRRRTTRFLGRPVDIGFYDPRLIQGQLPAGEMKVRDVYSLFPDNSHLVILKFRGDTLRRFAEELTAQERGAVSGIRMQIRDGRPRGVLIGISAIEPDSVYTMATTERVVDEPGVWRMLKKYKGRSRLDLRLHQAFIEYVQARRSISPAFDQRIRK